MEIASISGRSSKIETLSALNAMIGEIVEDSTSVTKPQYYKIMLELGKIFPLTPTQISNLWKIINPEQVSKIHLKL